MKPRRPDHLYKPRAQRFLQTFPGPIAHRGLWRDGIDENTLEAINAAAEAGLAAEIDVRLSGDGVPVVYHDTTTLRLGGEEAKVSELSASELKASGTPNNGTIPTLREALEEVGGRVPLLVEVKQEGPVGELETATAVALGQAQAQAAVQSFNPRSVGWFRRNDPERLRGMLSAAFNETPMHPAVKALLRSHLPTVCTRPDFIGYDIEALPHRYTENVARMLGIPLIGWTVRSPHMREGVAVARIIFEGFVPDEEAQPDA